MQRRLATAIRTAPSPDSVAVAGDNTVIVAGEKGFGFGFCGFLSEMSE